ncbi:hypothetical protein B0H63DRAFT_498041 [Podospora didyma]|uniref:Transmembrane protein n=1 Tax=Podospora didyma TaxID=330526 RepID=A0AAE0N2I7_9PEZI|nr:hypothetical protein B0H63DRAFT_498041 [Podospora didyma]
MSLQDGKVLPFPEGFNSSDTVIAGVHLNKTVLQDWNYSFYSNNTLSNNSFCVLAFKPWNPDYIFPNGSWVNETWCYKPVNSIGVRAGVGLGFGIVFGLLFIPVLMNLQNHGKLHLPAESRFRPIGRRWQWYWAILTITAALISLFTNIDVDRYFLPELPLILTCFFWFIMQMCAIATVWEAVRHWGSWMERQFVDPNPFVLKLDDRRANIEFWVPLFFYLCLWLNFFLIVPRNWGIIEHQRYPMQVVLDAEPAATDGRFKAAAFVLVACWLTIAFSVWHSIKHYCERNRGIFNRAIGIFRFMPYRFLLLMPIALAICAYQALCAWKFDYSPLNVYGSRVAIYVGGYLPALLILIIQSISGFMRPNEDKELLRQRRERGTQIDRELGLAAKPAWWRRAQADYVPHERMRDRIARNVRELGGGKATARNLDTIVDARSEAAAKNNAAGALAGEDVEMGPVSPTPLSKQATDLLGPINDFGQARTVANQYAGRSERRRAEHATQAVAGLLFPGANADPAARAARHAELMMDGPPPPPYKDDAMRPRPRTGERSRSTETTNSITGPPQQIKSMLDI